MGSCWANCWRCLFPFYYWKDGVGGISLKNTTLLRFRTPCLLETRRWLLEWITGTRPVFLEKDLFYLGCAYTGPTNPSYCRFNHLKRGGWEVAHPQGDDILISICNNHNTYHYGLWLPNRGVGTGWRVHAHHQGTFQLKASQTHFSS